MEQPIDREEEKLSDRWRDNVCGQKTGSQPQGHVVEPLFPKRMSERDKDKERKRERERVQCTASEIRTLKQNSIKPQAAAEAYLVSSNSCFVR